MDNNDKFAEHFRPISKKWNPFRFLGVKFLPKSLFRQNKKNSKNLTEPIPVDRSSYPTSPNFIALDNVSRGLNEPVYDE